MWLILNQPVLQDVKKSFKDIHLDIKMCWISPESLWNSTDVKLPMYRLGGPYYFPHLLFSTSILKSTFQTLPFCTVYVSQLQGRVWIESEHVNQSH